MGTDVYTKGRTGPVGRVRSKGRNPRSTAQTTARGNLSKSAATYKNLTSAQIAAWATFASSVTKHNGVTGKAYSPTPLAAFTALSSKFLQCSPAGTIPVAPPASAFAGDSISVTGVGAAGQATFTASAANAAGVKTELLVQPLKSKNRTPAPKGYRSKGFVAFAAGSLTSNVALTPGSYALGYRFVNVATGQATAMVALTVVTVS